MAGNKRDWYLNTKQYFCWYRRRNDSYNEIQNAEATKFQHDNKKYEKIRHKTHRGKSTEMKNTVKVMDGNLSHYH